MSILIKGFFVAVYQNGDREIAMNIQPVEYKDLSLILIGGHYCGRDLVSEAIIGLKNVVSGKSNSFMFASEDCRIEAIQDTANITIDFFDDHYSFQLPTSEILIFMEEWLDFLKSYYSNEIPGLPYPPPPVDWFKNKRNIGL
jgi:hypothetical protein